MYLTGYQPTADKTGVSDDTRGLGTTNGKLRMPPDYANGVQTSVSKISAILDSRENAFVTSGKVAFDPTQNTFNSKTTQTIFDSNGTGHTLEVFYRRVSDTRMAIMSNADGSGYSYKAGFNAVPNTSQTQNVLIPKASALSIQSAPKTTLLGGVVGQPAIGNDGVINFESGTVNFAAGSAASTQPTTSTITLTGASQDLIGKTLFVNGTDQLVHVTGVTGNTVTLSGINPNAVTNLTNISFKGIDLPASLAAGDKIFMNGVDTGFTIKTGNTYTANSGGANIKKIYTVAVTAPSAGSTFDIPASAAFTFYKADIAATASAVANAGTNTITSAGAASDMVGRRLFNGTTDTGLTVTNVTGNTITLDGNLSANIASASNLFFKQTLDMSLTAPDGTKIVVQGTTNKQSSGTILNAVQSNLEVYASINGVFYDHSQAGNTFSSKPGAPDVETTGGYQTVAKIGLVAGRNIDSLMVDGASGKPVFSTSAKLSTRVNAGSQQSTTIPLIYELDLSDTQLQASSFVVNQSYQNGEPRSELSSVTIDGAGTIVGVYGNGRKIVAGQIALAQFDADEQLIPTGGHAFAPSYRSGTEGDNGVRIGRAGEGSFGEIKSMAVEASTVDLSNELVKLMILQRMYSANSQSIKAFDQTLRDTIQMTS
jgi:flagellar hook-basal body protein